MSDTEKSREDLFESLMKYVSDNGVSFTCNRKQSKACGGVSKKTQRKSTHHTSKVDSQENYSRCPSITKHDWVSRVKCLLR